MFALMSGDKEFDCKRCGECCEIIAFEIPFFQKMKKHTQKPYELKDKFYNGDRLVEIPKKHYHDFIYPVTEDGKCVFNKIDMTCAIYTQRPDLCRLFGTVPFLLCKQVIKKI